MTRLLVIVLALLFAGCELLLWPAEDPGIDCNQGLTCGVCGPEGCETGADCGLRLIWHDEYNYMCEAEGGGLLLIGSRE